MCKSAGLELRFSLLRSLLWKVLRVEYHVVHQLLRLSETKVPHLFSVHALPRFSGGSALYLARWCFITKLLTGNLR